MGNNRKFLAVASAVALSAFAVQASAESLLRWSDGGPNRGIRAKSYEWFAEEAAKRTNGEVKFEFHWAGALLKSKASLKGVGAGAADVATAIAAYTPKELIAYSVGDLPLQISDTWVTLRATYELATTHPALVKMFDGLNLIYLSNVTTSASQLICTKQHIETIEDFKGKKIRAVGVYGKVFKDLGANMVRMSQSKVYTALDSGVVECNQNYTYAIPVFKQHEVAKKMTKLDWGQFLGFGIIMNKEVFGKLSPASQKAMREIGSDYIDFYAKNITEANAESLETIKAAGVEIMELPAAEKAKLQAAAQSHIDGWVKRADKAGLPGQDIFDAYQKLLQKYEDIRVKQGYPWQRS